LALGRVGMWQKNGQRRGVYAGPKRFSSCSTKWDCRPALSREMKRGEAAAGNSDPAVVRLKEARAGKTGLAFHGPRRRLLFSGPEGGGVGGGGGRAMRIIDQRASGILGESPQWSGFAVTVGLIGAGRLASPVFAPASLLAWARPSGDRGRGDGCEASVGAPSRTGLSCVCTARAGRWSARGSISTRGEGPGGGREPALGPGGQNVLVILERDRQEDQSWWRECRFLSNIYN